MSGVTAVIPASVGGTKPPGVAYRFKDQNTVTFGGRAQRVF
jgi:hypothetical protein